jgi:hypothetical protein
MEKLFDETVKKAIKEGLVSLHTSADGTLVRANASFKSFDPVEVFQTPEQYKTSIRNEDSEKEAEKKGPDDYDKGKPEVNFHGEKRSNKTHRSKTDPDCRLVSKGTSGSGAYPGYTVNALMENRNRFLLGMNVEIFKGPLSETKGCLSILDKVKKKIKYTPKTLGADKGYFAESFINNLFEKKIEPHIAAKVIGKKEAHKRVRMRERGCGYNLSQKCRKKIEELFGEAKDNHGLRRVKRRSLERVKEEVFMIGMILNMKRLASLC